MVKKRELRIYLWLLFAFVLINVSLSFYCADNAWKNTEQRFNAQITQCCEKPFIMNDQNSSICCQVQNDLLYLPYDTQYSDKITYDDTFGADRSTNADYSDTSIRTHEGCDLMYSANVRGEVPICSMSNGVIENIGWLPLGGWRIGIRSDSGIYYYYAHLYSYASDLKAGSKIIAGQFLGFMGDTGYGDEGTYGQFPVHLHVGIYVPKLTPVDVNIQKYIYLQGIFFQHPKKPMTTNEISINPYPFLKWLESGR